MTYKDLVSERPAFASHQKYQRARRRQLGPSKKLCDCCFSIANLVIIVTSIIALIYTVQFLYDTPLYEYGEHLLGIRFYRQIIYIIAILPLIFLVPIYNAADALLITSSSNDQIGSVLLTLKLAYEFLAIVLAFIGLIFVAPSIRSSSLESQLELEIRRYMKKRYDNEFSYEFLDRIQQDYKCCDEAWYRVNYYDKVPLSCTEPINSFDIIYSKTCSEVIGNLVSNRCAIIAACLLAILISLGILVATDILDRINKQESVYTYDFKTEPIERDEVSDVTRSRLEVVENDDGEHQTRFSASSPLEYDTNLVDTFGVHDDYIDDDDDEHLKLSQKPTEPVRAPAVEKSLDLDDDDDELSKRVSPIAGDRRPIISPSPDSSKPMLARAHLALTEDSRPRSPLVVVTCEHTTSTTDTRHRIFERTKVKEQQRPIRGVLKKTSSFQRINDDEEDADLSLPLADDSDPASGGQSRSSSVASTKRSLLNVRFADE